MAAAAPLETEELHLLASWGSSEDRARAGKAGAASILLHLLGLLLVAAMPKDFLEPPASQRAAQRQVTALVFPRELTQPAPNQGPVRKEVRADEVLPRPRISIPPSPPSMPRPAARQLTPPPSRSTAPAPALPDPPKVEAGLRNVPPLPNLSHAPPPPQIQAQEKPKIAFENPAQPAPAGGAGGGLALPNPSVSEAIRSVARGGSGGLTVGDVGEPGLGGVGPGLEMRPSPGRQASNLELLSDPQGVDFRPYLIAILSAVRRNWFAVMPESANLGRRGKVSIQFAINRDGHVPKLVIVGHSGTDALDRAAVAGISASNPFPPLPTGFKGDQVRLQFNFLYNLRN